VSEVGPVIRFWKDGFTIRERAILKTKLVCLCVSVLCVCVCVCMRARVVG